MEASTAEQNEQEGTAGNVGRIEEIQGVVIEASFPGDLPEINNAITVAHKDDEGNDLTLEMNRARQAEITQEIMEVVAGAEALV